MVKVHRLSLTCFSFSSDRFAYFFGTFNIQDVRPSVRHKSCPLYKLKTVKDFSMKLGTLVNHKETRCHAQEP